MRVDAWGNGTGCNPCVVRDSEVLGQPSLGTSPRLTSQMASAVSGAEGGTYLCLTAWKNKQVMNVTQAQADAIPTGFNQSCTPTDAANRVIRKSDGTAYDVDSSLVRHWIPNGGTDNCVTRVRGIPVINNVTQGHVDALAAGSDYRCRAILHMADDSFYVDSSGYRFLIPNSPQPGSLPLPPKQARDVRQGVCELGRDRCTGYSGPHRRPRELRLRLTWHRQPAARADRVCNGGNCGRGDLRRIGVQQLRTVRCAASPDERA